VPLVVVTVAEWEQFPLAPWQPPFAPLATESDGIGVLLPQELAIPARVTLRRYHLVASIREKQVYRDAILFCGGDIQRYLNGHRWIDSEAWLDASKDSKLSRRKLGHLAYPGRRHYTKIYKRATSQLIVACYRSMRGKRNPIGARITSS